jgi:hypothetical protein
VNDLVAANHAYSILGTADLGGIPCVVLRNPFGVSITPPQPPIHECPDWIYPISVSEGNFCLEMDAFISIFEAVGFII